MSASAAFLQKHDTPDGSPTMRIMAATLKKFANHDKRIKELEAEVEERKRQVLRHSEHLARLETRVQQLAAKP